MEQKKHFSRGSYSSILLTFVKIRTMERKERFVQAITNEKNLCCTSSSTNITKVQQHGTIHDRVSHIHRSALFNVHCQCSSKMLLTGKDQTDEH